MSKLKSFLTNPVALASQGFLVGAALLWTNTIPLDPAQAPVAPPVAAERTAS